MTGEARMSYDSVRSVHRLIEEGIGDAARLEYILDRLEKGKYLYLSDQKYLENLLSSNQMNMTESAEPKVESNALEKLENDLMNLNSQLENILRNKRITNRSTENHPIVESQKQETQKLKHKPAITSNKNEEITLILSVVLGLISLQGIGHMYVGRIARGTGILVLSLLISAFSISYVIGFIPKETIPNTVSVFFLPILVAGYFMLYVFQILDGRRLCVVYNQHVAEHGKRPSWW
jgi:TM2 domain-containing membrane protein YozV